MTTLLLRAFATFRTWLGLNDPSETRLHAPHGWLLPPSAARPQLQLALAPAPVPSARSRRA